MKPSVILFWCVCFLYDSLLSIEGDKVIRCSASNFMKLSSCRLLQEKLFTVALPLDSKLALFCESNNEGVSCSVLVCLFLLYARITPGWDSLLSIDGDKASRCWASSFMNRCHVDFCKRNCQFLRLRVYNCRCFLNLIMKPSVGLRWWVCFLCMHL